MTPDTKESVFSASPKLDPRLRALRAAATQGRDPATEDETLNLLLAVARAAAPSRILEVGTAEGLTSVALLQECAGARLTTVEMEEERWLRAKENFSAFGVADRVNAILGDAADVLPSLEGQFELIIWTARRRSISIIFPY